MIRLRLWSLCPLAASVLLAGPSMVWAGPVLSLSRVAPATTVTRATARAFDVVSIARAVDAELAAPHQSNAQEPPQASVATKRDSIWNGVLIGAGVGGALGAIYAATGEDCLGYVEPGGAEVCVMRTDPDVGLNLAFGALVGAGVGAIVDLLIK